MLRKIRRTLAVLFFACITLLFLDFTGTLHAWLGWMARVQFLPAVLALNVGVVGGACGADAPFRPGLLLGRLPARGVSGFRRLARRPREKAEVSFLLLSGPAVAALRDAGAVRRGAGRPAWVRWSLCLRRTAPTDVSPPTSSVRFISGATMRWPRSPSVWEAMRSMKRRSGWRACRRC